MLPQLLLYLFLFALLARPCATSSRGGSSSSSSRYYDKQVNVFNAEGDLPQLAYADIAASRGDSLICLVTEDNCVVLCTPTSARAALQDRRVIDKINKIDDGIWAAFAGLAGDGRSLIRMSRKISASYRLNFNAPPTLRYLTKSIADVNHEATLSGGERPYGVNLLFLGYEPEADTPQIFLSRASGHLSQWRAVAIGRNADRAMAHLESRLVASAKEKLVRKPATAIEAAEIALDVFRQEDMATSFSTLGREGDKDKDESADSTTNSPATSSNAANEEHEAPRTCDLYLLRRSLQGPAVLTAANDVTNATTLLETGWTKIVPVMNKVVPDDTEVSALSPEGATASKTLDVSGGFTATPEGASVGAGKERRALRAIANRMKSAAELPVVSCAGSSASDAFTSNLADVLKARGLAQVKFNSADKKECKAMAQSLAEKTGSEVVQVIGHTGLLYLRGTGAVESLLAKELASSAASGSDSD